MRGKTLRVLPCGGLASPNEIFRWLFPILVTVSQLHSMCPQSKASLSNHSLQQRMSGKSVAHFGSSRADRLNARPVNLQSNGTTKERNRYDDAMIPFEVNQNSL